MLPQRRRSWVVLKFHETQTHFERRSSTILTPDSLLCKGRSLSLRIRLPLRHMSLPRLRKYLTVLILVIFSKSYQSSKSVRHQSSPIVPKEQGFRQGTELLSRPSTICLRKASLCGKYFIFIADGHVKFPQHDSDPVDTAILRIPLPTWTSAYYQATYTVVFIDLLHLPGVLLNLSNAHNFKGVDSTPSIFHSQKLKGSNIFVFGKTDFSNFNFFSHNVLIVLPPCSNCLDYCYS